MSITVFIRTPSEVHPVKISGNETLRSLHDKAAEAAGITDPATILLSYEGSVLENGTQQVQQTELLDETEVLLEKTRSLHVEVEDMETMRENIRKRAEQDPNFLLVVNTSGCNEGVLEMREILIDKVRHLKITDLRGNVSVVKNNEDGEKMSDSLVTVVVDLPSVRVVKSFFLSNVKTLKSADFSRLSVRTIDRGFLHNCASLTTVSLPLCSLCVGNNFLSCCGSLTQIDFSPLQDLRTIGNMFLTKSGLTSVDLSPLRGVLEVGSHFLSFTEITAVDLAPLQGLERLGFGLLNGCSGLSAVDLTPLANVKGGMLTCLEMSGVPEAQRKIPRKNTCCAA